jgi:hypothetical protein
MPGTPPTRFVFLGPEGTFAEQALRTIPAAEQGQLAHLRRNAADRLRPAGP